MLLRPRLPRLRLLLLLRLRILSLRPRLRLMPLSLLLLRAGVPLPLLSSRARKGWRRPGVRKITRPENAGAPPSPLQLPLRRCCSS